MLARAGMLAERVLRAFWPFGSLILFAGSAFAFGLPAHLPPGWALPIGLVIALAAVVLLALGLAGFRWPTEDEALARIDTALPGRPLAALGDTLAVGRGRSDTEVVWQQHLARMAAVARAARAGWPDLRLSARDPWALRLMAVTAAIAALVFARTPPGDTFGAMLPQKGGAAAIATGPSFEAWAAPPAYTGKPVLYLSEVPQDQPVQLPSGTVVTLRAYGDETTFSLTETVSGTAAALAEAAAGIQAAEFTVVEAGSVSLTEGGRSAAAWQVTVIPDTPPTIALDGEISRTPAGAMELGFTAADDYGVARGYGTARLNLADVDRRFGLVPDPVPRPPIEFDLPMPFSGNTVEVEETLIEDLSKHPWAGLPVIIGIHAEDDAGQVGSETGIEVLLPGRRFFDPLAAAIVEQRRDLLWSPENATRIGQVLKAVTARPATMFEDDIGVYTAIRTAIRRLGYAAEDGLDTAEVDDIAEHLWQIALMIEDGSLANAAERLRRAQERLSEALENGATDEEIAQLTEEMRQAMDEYLRQLAEQALENPQQQQAERQQGQEISPDTLQQMLDRIQELAEQGRNEEAQALLQQLQQMLENLQMQAQQGGQGQGQQGQQMMQELQDALRQQQDLADDSFQQLQRQFGQGQGQGQRRPGENGQPPQGQMPGQGQQSQPDGLGQGGDQLSADELARRQEALRQMLDDFNGRLPQPGTEDGEAARRSLEEAERGMGEARDQLDQGDLADALESQSGVLEQLREGMRGLDEEMRQAQQEGQPGGEGREGLARDDRDPLGRPRGARGRIDTNDRLLPGEDPFARARDLFEEIRRRSSDQSRPSEELDYLRRLLDRF